MTGFEKAESVQKRHKLMLWGPPGCFKTRTMLKVGGGLATGVPTLSVIDTEFGTDWYAGEFNFNRKQTVDTDEVMSLVKQTAANPGDTKTIGLDTFTIYYEALVDKYADLFLKREATSKGNKGEYYVIQPRDYQAINREAYRLVRNLLKCDLNVICVFQIKDEWKEMKATGDKIFDGPKRMAYYFDTLIEIDEHRTKGFVGRVKKDRSHVLTTGQLIDWSSEEKVYEVLKKFDLTGGPEADGWEDPTEAREEAKQEVRQETRQEPKQEQTPVVEKEKSPVTEKMIPEVTTSVAAGPVESAPAQTETKEVVVEAESPPVIPDATIEDIVNLKKTLRIVDRVQWDKLIKEYDVKTARDLNQAQLNLLRDKLTNMLPSKAQAS